ncbi:MAG: long-chain fatty acid--CoA ligase [Thermoleophilia bacterium]|nr:long-chain fatty acid--CoA ligase [Thermoleophilia bacterium]
MDDPFQQRALELYGAQRAAIPAYDAWCSHELATRGADAEVAAWRDIPALPIAAFKSLEVFDPAAPVAAEWRSSGTTSADRSRHRLATLGHYDHAIDLGVDAALVPDVATGARPPLACVQLQPSGADAPHSSLSYMYDRIRTGERCRDAGAWVDAEYGVDAPGAWEQLTRLAGSGEPVLVLATSFALVLLLDAVRDAGLPPIQLPPASRVVDTGGYKGRTRELTREELVARTGSWLGVPAEWCENEYGMSELSSQAWLGTVAAACGLPLPELADAPGGRWFPPTMRVRVVDPVSLEEVADGEPGLLVFHDIANVHSCAAIRSEDIGTRRGSSFELVGRAPGAVLKGCSLHLEELPA